MPHEPELIANVTYALAFAFIGGFLAKRLSLPPIVGYMLAGVAIGPHTPGFIGNPEIATQLAEIGVVLLMYGVGIHFSLRDLLAVRSIAIPGAVAQIAVATALGIGVAFLWGWGLGAGLVLGLAVSVASTVVLVRALAERGVLDSTEGRVAVGWLIVEDLFTVIVLVVLPGLSALLGGSEDQTASGSSLPFTLALILGKVALFVLLMALVGSRVVPWLLLQVARTDSQELFTLAVLVVALGIAFFAAELFGISLALGAFVAGIAVGGSELSHQAAENSVPFRDAFAVLFFVSVGLLLDPASLLAAPGPVLVILAIIVLAKPLTAFLIVSAFRYPIRTGLTVSAGLAQIGEFSFILAELGLDLGLLPPQGYNLVIAAALLSITVNPFLFATIDPIDDWLHARMRS